MKKAILLTGLVLVSACSMQKANNSLVGSDSSSKSIEEDSSAFPTDAEWISMIKPELTSVVVKAPNCPPNAMCEPYSELTFSFTMSGCMDVLGQVFTSRYYDDVNDKTVYEISGVNIHRELSNRVDCIAAKVERKVIYDRAFLSKDDIIVHPLTTTVQDIVKLPEGTYGISVVSAKLINVEMYSPEAPEGMNPQPASKLSFEFGLDGCVDQLANVVYARHDNEDGSKREYEISGLNIKNKMSKLTRCIQQPVEMVEIYDRAFLDKEDIVVNPLFEVK